MRPRARSAAPCARSTGTTSNRRSSSLMDRSVVGAVVAVGVVVLVGLLARRGSRDETPMMPRPDGGEALDAAGEPDAPDDDEDEAEDEPVEVVAGRSGGYA